MLRLSARYLAISAAIAALGAGGCGGSGSGLTPTSAGSIQVGQAQIGYSGTLKPALGVGEDSVQVTGFAGSAFTSFVLNPPKTLANTRILLADGAGALWSSLTDGFGGPIGGFGNGYVFRGDWTHDGHILYVALDLSTDAVGIYECNWDGSSTRLITTTHVTQNTRAVWSPLNNLIAYDDGVNNIYTMNTNGTGITLRVTGGYDPAFSPNGSLLAFDDNVTSRVATIPTGGGSIVQVTATPCADPDWSPDGKAIITTDDGTTPSSLTVWRAAGGGLVFFHPGGTSTGYSAATWSPDGAQIAYEVTGTGSGINVSPFSGQGFSQVYFQQAQFLYHPSWSPFPGAQTLVGSGGTVLASAAGFLWSQNVDVFAGFAAFTATTPTTATITEQGTATSSYSPLVFDLHADAITSLKYTNGMYSAVTSIPTGNLSDVLVSVSGSNGQVGNVAPFLATRGAERPTVKRVGETTICSGRFAGLWDSKGKNLAPNGLSEFRLGAKGALISFR